MKNFRCPICYDKLTVTGQARLETLNEHICDPNGLPRMKDKYECTNVNCPAFIEKMFWNEDGEYYVHNFKLKPKFIANNNAPFGSFQRQMNIEIYKKDENYILLNFYYFKIKVEFRYKSNENGTILERKRRFIILKRETRTGGWIHWMSPWRMFFFQLNQFKHNLKLFNDISTNEYTHQMAQKLKRDYFNDDDKRFYRKVAKIFINLFYQNINYEIKDIILDYKFNRKH